VHQLNTSFRYQFYWKHQSLQAINNTIYLFHSSLHLHQSIVLSLLSQFKILHSFISSFSLAPPNLPYITFLLFSSIIGPHSLKVSLHMIQIISSIQAFIYTSLLFCLYCHSSGYCIVLEVPFPLHLPASLTLPSFHSLASSDLRAS
jgi:hypothetical protein